MAGPVGFVSLAGKLLSLPLIFFGGRPNWKATELQLQSGILRFFSGRPSYNCDLETRDFLVAGPVGSRQGCNCNLESCDFWWQALLESDLAGSCFSYH